MEEFCFILKSRNNLSLERMCQWKTKSYRKAQYEKFSFLRTERKGLQIDWWETDDPLAREECGLRLEIWKQTSLDVEVMPMRASRGNRPENKIVWRFSVLFLENFCNIQGHF